MQQIFFNVTSSELPFSQLSGVFFLSRPLKPKGCSQQLPYFLEIHQKSKCNNNMQERADFPLHDSAIRVLFSHLGILLLACRKPRQAVTNDFQVEHKAQIELKSGEIKFFWRSSSCPTPWRWN
jgi:hypothetical protein